MRAATDYFVYYGGKGFGPRNGIALGRFKPATGVLTAPKIVVESDAPTYFVFSPDRKYLYAGNHHDAGALSAYKINPVTGGLKFLNKVPSHGPGPCHVAVDNSGRCLAASNYDGGSLVAYALKPDGSIGPLTFFEQRTGRSVHPQRQGKAYAHSVNFDPTNRFLLSCDLGLDKIFIYKFDEKTGAITLHDPDTVATARGAGPRKLIFHPNGKIVYVVNELDTSVSAYKWNSAKGTLKEFQTITRLPKNFAFADGNTGSELTIQAKGKFLYVSNRDTLLAGHDTVAVFAINPATFKLKKVQDLPTRKTPRFITLDPTGKWFIVGSQNESMVSVFAVNEKSGALAPSKNVEVPSVMPTCIQFLAAPAK